MITDSFILIINVLSYIPNTAKELNIRAPVWIEIPADDIERAVAFYRELFQMDLEIKDYGKLQMAHFLRECGFCGAIASSSPEFKPAANRDGIIIHFAIDNMKRALELVENSSAELRREPVPVADEGVGEYAVIKDTEGNIIGLFNWEDEKE